MIKQRLLTALLMGGIIATGAYAQAEKGDSDDMTKKTHELNPVVVTGTGTHQRLKNTPSPVSVITANEIKRAGITDFQQALTMMVPSLSFRPNAMGSYLMMNGLSNKHVLILVNGRKVTGDITGNIDLNQIDMTRVKRIEVLNGAASSLYGSDAIGGVINIITNEPKDVVAFSSNSSYTRKNQFSQGLNLDIAQGKIGSYTSYKYDHSDGWQNSHLHRFCLPDAQFRALADNNTQNYARLVGVVFRSPWMDEEEQFWADDYEEGSFKTWLKRKYTAPYKSLCYGESLYQCEQDVAELEQRYAYCRVQRTRYDDGPDFFGDPEAISRAEYLRLKAKTPLKTKKTTKYGHSEVSYQEVHKFAEIPFDSIRWFGESVQAGSLLERLPIGEVLHPLCDCTKTPVKPPMQFSEFMTAAQCDEVARCTGSDSPAAQPHVHPFTDTLYYNYDFGDDWHVQITARPNAEDLIESKRLTSEELDEAVLQLHSKRRPVCIAQDGLPVFDDVGNIHGYAAFLKCISRDIRKKVYAVDDIEEDEGSPPYPYQDKHEVLEWAKSLGWSKRKVSNKNLL